MTEKPVKPDESECCGSGCKPCIFDVYEEKLKQWETRRDEFIESKALNQTKYLPFVITQVQDPTESLKVFRFQAVVLKRDSQNGVLIKKTESGLDYKIIKDFLNIKAGQYLIMKGSHETSTISRPYTPILNKEDFENGAFTVVISLQAKGRMSCFFMQLDKDDIVFWRGPYQEFMYQSNSYRNVLLIGGGTGVVPLYNIARSIVENEEDDTWVNVICSFSSADSFLLREEFGRLGNFWNFRWSVYISGATNCDFKPKYNESIVFTRIDETVIGEQLEKCGERCLTVVCGPQSFNQFVKDSLVKVGVKEENIFIFW